MCESCEGSSATTLTHVGVSLSVLKLKSFCSLYFCCPPSYPPPAQLQECIFFLPTEPDFELWSAVSSVLHFGYHLNQLAEVNFCPDLQQGERSRGKTLKICILHTHTHKTVFFLSLLKIGAALPHAVSVQILRLDMSYSMMCTEIYQQSSRARI